MNVRTLPLLGLTAGAVSHQIRALEKFLEVASVERQGKKWRLTDSGRIYGYQVRQALQDVADVTNRLLMGDQLMLLASPQLLEAERPSHLQALLQLPLLHASENWSTWLGALPKTNPQLQRPPTLLEFTDSTHLLEAARLSLGVALSRRSIADSLLLRRELVPAHAACEAFADWLEGACARFAAQALG